MSDHLIKGDRAALVILSGNVSLERSRQCLPYQLTFSYLCVKSLITKVCLAILCTMYSSALRASFQAPSKQTGYRRLNFSGVNTNSCQLEMVVDNNLPRL